MTPLAGDEQFAQDMKIATKDAQLQVTAEALVASVSATRQAVARLQGTDRRLHSRMTLARAVEGNARRGLLLGSLVFPRLGKTYAGDDLGQLLLVRRRVEAAVEREVSDATPETRLHFACLFHHHVAVVLVARQEAAVEDEARGVLIDEQLAAELHRLRGLASLVELRVGLEDAEELLFPRDLFVFQNTAAGDIADDLRALHVNRQFRRQRFDIEIDGAHFPHYSSLISVEFRSPVWLWRLAAVRKPGAAQQLADWLSNEIVARLCGAAMSIAGTKTWVKKVRKRAIDVSRVELDLRQWPFS